MTKEELVALEIERRALLQTVYQLGKGDARIETRLNELCQKLENKAAAIQKIIKENLHE